MIDTYLDEFVEYPVKALHVIGTDNTVVSLLTNNPQIDMDSDEADSVFERYLFDYGYVDGTTGESEAYICVEAEVSSVPTPTIKDMKVYVTVFCHKQYMKIDTSKFKGMIGNRRDNLVRYVDKLLNGSEMFGIGQLKLDYARTIPAPIGFTARELSYTVHEFKNKGVM